MTKQDIEYIKTLIDEISNNKYSEEMLDLLRFMCNLMANDVGTEFLRGGQIHRDFIIEELKIKISYVGDKCQN